MSKQKTSKRVGCLVGPQEVGRSLVHTSLMVYLGFRV